MGQSIKTSNDNDHCDHFDDDEDEAAETLTMMKSLEWVSGCFSECLMRSNYVS